MHPALAHKYGLRSEEEIAIAEHLVASAKRLGVSDADVALVLEFHGTTLAPLFERGVLDDAGAVQMITDFAAARGMSSASREGLSRWYARTGDHIATHGVLPAVPPPAQRDLAAERAEIERVMREEPDRYWRDPDMQHRLYDLIDQSSAQTAPQQIASAENIARLGQIEASMYQADGSPNPTYWKNDAAQSEYRNILNLGAPAAAESASGGGSGEQESAA